MIVSAHTKALCVALIALSGCAHPTIVHEPVEVEVVRYEVVPVPEALLQPCKVTPLSLNTNAELELALAEALVELKRCTQDKEAIRGLE